MASKNSTIQHPSYYQQLGRLPTEFPYKVLEKATDNFTIKLGSGMSGTVFKGKLDDGSFVAVKRIDGAGIGKRLFETEISMIASVQHVNLVRLRGYGSHTTETGKVYLFIVYHFLSKGSMDSWIFPGSPGGRFLSWKQRYQAAIDVARVLVYLHDFCSPAIYHLDIKPANILLDDKFQAVLADFGLSKLTNADGSELQSVNVRGTKGYIAPEMIRGNRTSPKCDIYSFGKVLFDIFFGQMYVILDMNGQDIYDAHYGNSFNEERTFHKFMREQWNKNDIMRFVDKRLELHDELEAHSLIDVALLCVDENPNKRPHSMQKVLRMLEDGKQDNEEPVHNIVKTLSDKHTLSEKLPATRSKALPSGSSPLNGAISNDDGKDKNVVFDEIDPSRCTLFDVDPFRGRRSFAECLALIPKSEKSGRRLVVIVQVAQDSKRSPGEFWAELQPNEVDGMKFTKSGRFKIPKEGQVFSLKYPIIKIPKTGKVGVNLFSSNKYLGGATINLPRVNGKERVNRTFPLQPVGNIILGIQWLTGETTRPANLVPRIDSFEDEEGTAVIDCGEDEDD